MTAPTTTRLVHIVCCDAALALCETTLPGGDTYTGEAGDCLVCVDLDAANRPCGAPGCDVGVDPLLLQLSDHAPLGRCRVCGCTDDDACPDGCSWVPDPAMAGYLCSACLVTAGPDPGNGPEVRHG
jgi:hypothetical protein